MQVNEKKNSYAWTKDQDPLTEILSNVQTRSLFVIKIGQLFVETDVSVREDVLEEGCRSAFASIAQGILAPAAISITVKRSVRSAPPHVVALLLRSVGLDQICELFFALREGVVTGPGGAFAAEVLHWVVRKEEIFVPAFASHRNVLSGFLSDALDLQLADLHHASLHARIGEMAVDVRVSLVLMTGILQGRSRALEAFLVAGLTLLGRQLFLLGVGHTDDKNDAIEMLRDLYAGPVDAFSFVVDVADYCFTFSL